MAQDEQRMQKDNKSLEAGDQVYTASPCFAFLEAWAQESLRAERARTRSLEAALVG